MISGEAAATETIGALNESMLQVQRDNEELRRDSARLREKLNILEEELQSCKTSDAQVQAAMRRVKDMQEIIFKDKEANKLLQSQLRSAKTELDKIAGAAARSDGAAPGVAE